MNVEASWNGSPRLLDEHALRRTLLRLAHEITERHLRLDGVVLVGIKTRGVPLAQRLADVISGLGHPRPSVLSVDPLDFRDDRPRPPGDRPPALRATGGETLPDLSRCTVVLVDDVLYTGRTQRAAIDAVLAAARPAAVEVLVLVDRGHREMPLRATYVGKNVPTASGDRVAVRLREVDGADGAWLLQGAPA
jgi:pyrimidine operon attenuation protein / uracil phosphoribosyltransferase